jgi:hypothetical protein
MINYSNIQGSDDRLNSILDRISKIGIKNIKKEEIKFLESYSVGKESEFNKKLIDEESENTFISDDGNFIFKFDRVEIEDDELKYINGVFIVPDITLKNRRIIKGELTGCIILFNDKTIAMDFTNGKHDIFEFIHGLEYEMDCFIDDIVNKIQSK